jgi:class 3 adenylate cyclase
MKATNQPYAIGASDARIAEILDLADNAFAEASAIPPSESLTYSNGFYVECAAMFIDIRGSSGLVDKHKSAALGRIYRAYISECIAVMNQDPNCGEIFIQGDCVGAVFHAPNGSDVDSVLARAAQLNSLVAHLNWRLGERGYATITCGIGLAVGRALMIKAGYKGSGISDVVWMGNVVNHAAKLCHQGNRGQRCAIQVSKGAYRKMSNANRSLLRPVDVGLSRSHYEGDILDNEMRRWTAEASQRPEDFRGWLSRYGFSGDVESSGMTSVRPWL